MRKYDQNCPVARTLDLIGDRWTLIILRDLFFGRTKFSDFTAVSRKLPPKVLSARLKSLMEAGLIERRVYSEHPLRAEYHLTGEGRSLLPVMAAIARWGIEHTFDEPAARAALMKYVLDSIPEAADLMA